MAISFEVVCAENCEITRSLKYAHGAEARLSILDLQVPNKVDGVIYSRKQEQDRNKLELASATEGRCNTWVIYSHQRNTLIPTGGVAHTPALRLSS